MAKRGMWDADRPVTVEMVAAELGVDLESYELRLDSVDHEHVAMGSSASMTGTHNAGADVWRIRAAMWHKMFRNVRRRDVTVIQFESGGLDHGEGWARCTRYRLDARLTDAELTGVLSLLEAGILPACTFDEEM